MAAKKRKRSGSKKKLHVLVGSSSSGDLVIPADAALIGNRILEILRLFGASEEVSVKTIMLSDREYLALEEM
jgi:hypothetical protein